MVSNDQLYIIRHIERKETAMKKLLLTSLIFGSLIGLANYTFMASASSQPKNVKTSFISKYEGTFRNKFYRVKKEFKVNLKFYDKQNTSVVKRAIVLPKGTVIVSHGEKYYKHYIVNNDFNVHALRHKLQRGISNDNNSQTSRLSFESRLPASKVTRITESGHHLPNNDWVFSDQPLKGPSDHLKK